MEILSLGHSSFVLTLAGDAGEPVRILVDPWLSDHAVGDLMGRFPRVRIDFGSLGPIHAIWISHGHTDHLDPESLLRLRRELEPFPTLLLPASLAHLVPLLAEFLDDPEIRILAENAPIDFRGVTLSGFFNPEPVASNEDDVMVLAGTNGTESFLSESDAVLPLDDPGTRARLADLILGPEIRAAAFLTTRNELGATMAMVAAKDREDRQARIGRVLESLDEELQAIFGPAAEFEDDLYADPRLVRLVGGQGLAIPPEVDPALNRVLFPIRIGDRVRMERETAAAFGSPVRIEPLVPGETHVVGAEGLKRKPSPAVEVLDAEEDRAYDPEADSVFEPPSGPLRDEARDREAQAARILAYANERFLPAFVGARRPPVEAMLGAGGGEWRIRIRFGTTADFEDRDLLASFARPRFAWATPEGEPAEHVRANDVEDVFDGRADEFSTLCRAPLPAPTQHLWLSLGMPWLNPDLVEKKLRLHFERAARGESNANFVLPFWRLA